MTAIPFGATRPNPPGQPMPTTHGGSPKEPARAVTPFELEQAIQDAWHILLEREMSDAAIAGACRFLITHCDDGRRDTAAEMLAVLDGRP